MPLKREPFGVGPGGEGVELVTLAHGAITVEILTYGGIVRRVLMPDRHGAVANVVLGRPTLADYLTDNSPYLGALVGRYANRIGGGAFVLDGVRYQLDRNEGSTTLHGGSRGFESAVWEVLDGAVEDGPPLVRLRHVSPAGEMGFPGTLTTTATYALRADGTLAIELDATTDAPTVVSLTSHGYWNLAGEGSGTIDGHVLCIHADHHTPIDEALIPTGTVEPVAWTDLDFRRPSEIGARPLEANYVLEAAGSGRLAHAADLSAPGSGRRLSLWTSAPGLQVYSADKLDGSLGGTTGTPLVARSGLALEPQSFPDSPNRPRFPSTELYPGDTYHWAAEFHLSTA